MKDTIYLSLLMNHEYILSLLSKLKCEKTHKEREKKYKPKTEILSLLPSHSQFTLSSLFFCLCSLGYPLSFLPFSLSVLLSFFSKEIGSLLLLFLLFHDLFIAKFELWQAASMGEVACVDSMVMETNGRWLAWKTRARGGCCEGALLVWQVGEEWSALMTRGEPIRLHNLEVIVAATKHQVVIAWRLHGLVERDETHAGDVGWDWERVSAYRSKLGGMGTLWSVRQMKVGVEQVAVGTFVQRNGWLPGG